MEAKDRKCLKCDQPGHRAAQCKSGLPLKEIGAEEGECWTVVEDGNKYPHMRPSAVSFEHQTFFQFSDNSSEDDAEEDVAYDFPYTLEVSAAGELENENAQYSEHQCFGMGCHARGLPCTAAMPREM